MGQSPSSLGDLYIRRIYHCELVLSIDAVQFTCPMVTGAKSYGKSAGGSIYLLALVIGIKKH